MIYSLLVVHKGACGSFAPGAMFGCYTALPTSSYSLTNNKPSHTIVCYYHYDCCGILLIGVCKHYYYIIELNTLNESQLFPYTISICASDLIYGLLFATV